uniref:NADH-ubiquinone oxidoreductase chain 6 n=1 Tax=Lopheros rubens TaxID=1588210 RepID=A0A343C4V6_9COLE|nr:NADH dehydrogenase subunit 6 [Lopheros rubens]
MSILMLMSMMTSMFLFTKHPLSMGLILMLQTILISASTGLMTNKFWYSYILFMIMIGGMLVLFMYMTSIASNKKFKFSWKMMMLSNIMMMISMMIMTTNDYLMNLSLNKEPNLELTISKYFNFPMSTITYLLIIYLLITLIAVVKITKTNFGPLRQM